MPKRRITEKELDEIFARAARRREKMRRTDNLILAATCSLGLALVLALYWWLLRNAGPVAVLIALAFLVWVKTVSAAAVWFLTDVCRALAAAAAGRETPPP